MNEKIFFFDLDGTIIDSKISIINTFNYVFLLNGLSKTNNKEFIRLANRGSKFFIKNKFPQLKSYQINSINAQFKKHYVKNCTKHIKLKKGVIFFLKKFKKKSIFYISTNKTKLASLKILKFLKIHKYFRHVYSGANIEYKKPIGKKLTKKVQSLKKKNKVLIVGDSEADEKFALFNKVDFALIRNGYTNKKVKFFSKKYVFKNFSDLIKILEESKKN